MLTLDTFDPQQIALRLAVAALVGMLVGFERESSHKGVGIRTFSLVSLFGTICALFGQSFALEGLGVITVLTVVATLRPSSSGSNNLGLTTAVALVSTSVLGMLIGFGHVFTPVAAAIIITMLLSLSEQFQRISDGISSAELRSGVLLGLIGFVIYPALPDHAIDRFGLINPREVWVTVVVIAAIGFLNYVLMRIYSRRGLFYAAFLGGLVSTTATIAEVAGWVKTDIVDPVSMGTTLSLLAVIAMLLRNVIILGIFSHSSAKLVAAPMLLMGLATIAAVYKVRSQKKRGPTEMDLDSPISITKVLRFAVLFLIIQISGTLAQRFFPMFGFLAVALIGGTVSSASTAAAAANLAAHGSLSPQLAATSVVISSITSALSNIPILHRITRRNDLTLRLTWITLAISAIGIAASLAELKLKVSF